jgi:hypothetical protein
MDILCEHDFTLQHIPGKINLLPDALSRLYSKTDKWGVDIASAQPKQSADAGHAPHEHCTTPAKDTVAVDGTPTDTTLQPEFGTGSDRGHVWVEHARAALADPISTDTLNDITITDLNNEKEREEFQRVLGKSYLENQRQQLIELAHREGHYGIKAVADKLYYQQNIWWPRMRTDITDYISRCENCQKYTIHKTGYHPTQSPTSTTPNEWWQADLMYLPTSRNGYSYVLTVLDIFSSYLIARPLRTHSSEEVGKNLLDIIGDFGPPAILQTDAGSEFENDIMKANHGIDSN